VTRAALRVSAYALLVAVGILALVLAGVGIVAAVEPGRTPSMRSLIFLLTPGALAASVAVTVGRQRQGGSWAGWQSLGRDPVRLFAPLGACALAAAALQLATGSSPAPLPPPVDAHAEVWWDAGTWEVPDRRWQVPPGELGPGPLVARWRSVGPAGSRADVDAAELLRRLGMTLAWVLALWAGVRVGADGRAPPRLAVHATQAGLAVLGWQLLVLLATAWVAAP